MTWESRISSRGIRIINRGDGTPMKRSPLISVVTPSFNQSSFIGEALASVRLQDYGNYEHLVIDGMSTDGTVDILHNLTVDRGLSNIFWVSERDSGQSEALNKGFQLAKGEIIGWLNSDDRYRAGCFEHVVKAFEDNPEVDIIYGDYLIVDEFGKTLQIRREIEFNAFVLLYHRVLYIPTTATFFRRRVFEEGNLLEEKLHYAMDLEFFIRLSARGYYFKHISEVLADFRLQPNSKTCSSANRQRIEHQQIVFAAAPIFRRLKSLRLKNLVLLLLQLMACTKRYSEKLLRGYYWSQLRTNRSSLRGV
jgi:glycosyltransferase involved in cell wall biosynthesis